MKFLPWPTSPTAVLHLLTSTPMLAYAGKVYKLKFLAMGGEYREVDCPDNMYILDAAEKGGIDLPGTLSDEKGRQSHPCA